MELDSLAYRKAVEEIQEENRRCEVSYGKEDFKYRYRKGGQFIYIDACTNIKDIRGMLDFVLNSATGEEKADMCMALTDIKKHVEQQGIKQGMEQSSRRINQPNQLLLAEGRQEDLLRSIKDLLFQEKLFMEYHI